MPIFPMQRTIAAGFQFLNWWYVSLGEAVMRDPWDNFKNDDDVQVMDSGMDKADDGFDNVIRVDEWGNEWDGSGDFSDMDFRLVDE